MTSRWCVGLGAGGVATLLLACGSLPWIREHTYPPDFHYITQAEIQGTMGQLAVEVGILDSTLRSGAPLDAAGTERMIETLERIQELTDSLKRGERSNHPRIDAHAEFLQRSVRRALEGARREPPSFYAAGQVSASCTLCHLPRHETRDAVRLGETKEGAHSAGTQGAPPAP